MSGSSRASAVLKRRRKRSHVPSIERLEALTLLSASPPVVSLGGSSAGGASLVKDILAGSNGSAPNSFANVGGTLFLQAFDSTNFINKLFVSDGTSANTLEVAPTLEPAQFISPVAIGNHALFTANLLGTTQFGIYSSDGTTAGTQLLGSLPQEGTNNAIAVGNVAYFDISDFAKSSFNPPEELWISDGTSTGTRMVTTIPQGPSSFAASGGKLYFTVDDGIHGNELWVSDGTAGGTGLVADLAPGSTSSFPQNLTDVGGTLFFMAQDGSAPFNQLWETTGTAASTVKIAPNLQPIQLVNFNGELLFTAEDMTTKADGVYISNGTTSGTQLVAALPAGAPTNQLTVAGNNAFFGFQPNNSFAFQLWKTNGSAAGTGLVASLADGSNFTASGGRLYFASTDATLGNVLFSSDGTSGGTGIVQVLSTGLADGSPMNLTDVGGTLFFDATDPGIGDELWKAAPPVQFTPPSINEGGSLSFSGSFSDQAADGPWTATVDYGDGSGAQPLTLGANNTFTLNHTYQDEGVYSVTVQVTGAGGTGSASASVTVLSVPPTASITGAPASSPEGTMITLGSSVTSVSPADNAAGFKESWTVLKDGVLYTSGNGANISFTPNDEGSYQVTLTAQDDGNNTSAPAVVTINVTSVAPTASISGVPASPTVLTPISLTGAATSPSPVSTSAGFTFAWTLTNPGGQSTGGSGSSFTFTPSTPGTYTVTLVATDEDGVASQAVTQTINATDPAPTASISGVPAGPTVFTPISLSGSATSPVAAVTSAGYTFAWTLTSPGGQTSTGSGASFGFTPSVPGAYTVTLVATDEFGVASQPVSQTITDTDPAPTAAINGAPTTTTVGTPISLTGSASSPSATVTAAGYTFAWTLTNPSGQATTGNGASFNFTPSAPGGYIVTLVATDEFGVASSPVNLTINVSDPAPTASISGAPATTTVGTPISLTGSASSPSAAVTAAGYTFAWTLTDPSGQSTGGSGASFSFTPSLVGTYTVSLVATDEFGVASQPVTQTITVNGVTGQPAVSIVGAPATADAGAPISLSSTVTGMGAGVTYSWVVTNRGQTVATGTAANFTFTPVKSGAYYVTLTVSDSAGDSANDSVKIKVKTPTTQVTAAGNTSVVPGQPVQLALSASSSSSTDNAAGFLFVVNWGDGSPEQTFGPAQSVLAGHVFCQSCFSRVTVTAVAQDGHKSKTQLDIDVDRFQLVKNDKDATKTDLVIGGLTASDTISFKPGTNAGSVVVFINGHRRGTFSVMGQILVFGQSGDAPTVVAPPTH